MKLNPPASSSDLAAARSIARRLHQRAYGAAVPDTGAESPLAARPPEPEAPRRPAPPPLPPQRPTPPPVVEPPQAREPQPLEVRQPEPPAVRAPEPPVVRPPEPPPVVREPERPEPPPRGEPERRPGPPARREPELEPEPPPQREPELGPERPWSEPPPRRSWDEEDEVPQIERGEPEAWEPPPAAPPPSRDEEIWEPPAVVEDDEEDIEIEQPAVAAESEVEEQVLEGPDDDDALAELTGGGGASSIEDLADAGPAFRPEPEQEFDESQFEPPPPPPGIDEPEFEPPGLEESPFGESGIGEPGIGPPGIDVDDELVSAGGDEAYEGDVDDQSAVPPGVSPEDLIGGPSEAPEPWAEEENPLDAEIEAAVGSPSPEDLIEVPAPPSWDDVADTCLGLAGARGAMLVEASGQVVSARGDWPNPGPEAIAARLVAMMERALRDAPTRSVSAPLAGQHLTAWRVPLGDTMLTAVFVGDAPVKADARTPIDEEIRQAAGA